MKSTSTSFNSIVDHHGRPSNCILLKARLPFNSIVDHRGVLRPAWRTSWIFLSILQQIISMLPLEQSLSSQQRPFNSIVDHLKRQIPLLFRSILLLSILQQIIIQSQNSATKYYLQTFNSIVDHRVYFDCSAFCEFVFFQFYSRSSGEETYEITLIKPTNFQFYSRSSRHLYLNSFTLPKYSFNSIVDHRGVR